MDTAQAIKSLIEMSDCIKHDSPVSAKELMQAAELVDRLRVENEELRREKNLQLDDYMESYLRCEQRAEKAEASLAVAVEALGKIASTSMKDVVDLVGCDEEKMSIERAYEEISLQALAKIGGDE